MTSNSPNNWTIIEAIGTILAAVVAAFSFIYFEFLRPLLFHPSISINYENRSPYFALHDLIMGGSPPNQLRSLVRQIRIGVKNTSNIPAKNIRLKLVAIASEDKRISGLFIPYDLIWVDTKETTRPILCKDEEALADFIIGVKIDPQYWWLQPYDPTNSTGFGNLAGLPKTMQPPYKAYAIFSAYAENMITPKQVTYEIQFNEPENLGEISMRRVRVRLSK